MKKLLFLLLLVAVANAGINVKGFELGGKVSPSVKSNNTYGGIECEIFPYTTNAGYIYAVAILPFSTTLDEEIRLNYYDLEVLTNGMIKAYGIKFKFVPKYDGSENDGSMVAEKDGTTYMIAIDHNQFYNKPYSVTIVIRDKALFNQHKREEVNERNSDF